ncbi:hypothetical protein BJY01DRAFT_41049 [Aspergillus pseudoustus]|uniref:Uncharacterized protein n=1 Tax=Aspergillus pseudoustus TaxID=1810923 RepID=A0ABR4JCH4_9EURO
MSSYGKYVFWHCRRPRKAGPSMISTSAVKRKSGASFAFVQNLKKSLPNPKFPNADSKLCI